MAMRQVDVIHRGKLSEQLADHLIDLIVDGTLVPGQALPTERDLAQRHGISVGVVREAAKRLAAVGLVDVRHGVGMYINPRERWDTSATIMLLVRADPACLLEMHEVRSSLELMAVARAAKLATPSDLQALDAASARMARAFEDPEAFVTADLDFHLALARVARNRILLPALQPLIEPIHECMLRGTLIPAAAPRAHAEHEQIAAAVRAQKPRQATDAMRRHLETSRGELEAVVVAAPKGSPASLMRWARSGRASDPGPDPGPGATGDHHGPHQPH